VVSESQVERALEQESGIAAKTQDLLTQIDQSSPASLKLVPPPSVVTPSLPSPALFAPRPMPTPIPMGTTTPAKSETDSNTIVKQLQQQLDERTREVELLQQEKSELKRQVDLLLGSQPTPQDDEKTLLSKIRLLQRESANKAQELTEYKLRSSKYEKDIEQMKKKGVPLVASAQSVQPESPSFLADKMARQKEKEELTLRLSQLQTKLTNVSNERDELSQQLKVGWTSVFV